MCSQPSTNLYPPLSHTFHRLRASLAETFPELIETLNGPVNSALLASFEQELGCPLPPSVRESLLIADGQDMDSGCNGLFFGLYLLPLDEVIREWTFWRQAEHDPDAGQNPALLATMASIPPNWIQGLYACRGWIPLISDRTGNYVGVDLAPGPGGHYGQVIVFGRDFDRKCVLWRGDGESGWGKWLSGFVDELESGQGWEADSSSDEEEVGYETYNGGAQAGEGGKGLRLAGEYRGWNVLEAWWDRSVRQWEQMGMGLDVEEVERGLSEARRLTGWQEAKPVAKPVEEIPGGCHKPFVADHVVSPQIEPPSTPIPGDSDVLLPPASPERPTRSKRPVRVITPVASHPLEPVSGRDLGLLTPPDRQRRKPRPPPAPTQLDLPTRADVQAMSAIAQAEASGLRGGWVMNVDAGRREKRNEAEMVDIDLEAGQRETLEDMPNGQVNLLPPDYRDPDRFLRKERESSVMSTGSQDGLLDSSSLPSRTASPIGSDSFDSPTTIKGRTSGEARRSGESQRRSGDSPRHSGGPGPSPLSTLTDGMEDVSLAEAR